MKIYDCITYMNEDIVLDLRLNYLNNYVDKFIIVESRYFHNGKKKKLFFDIKKFSKFKKKIVYLVLDHEPKDIEPINSFDSAETKNSKHILNGMKRDFYQRNYIMNGLKESNDNDIILISDIDEIPKMDSLDIKSINNELIFFNPNSTILEGQLRFSLLDGQKVVDYALEINNIYRHASVVPKSIGKQAYENTIRRRIDPALLEKTIGNNFSTRLYPLPANGYKRVKITVQEILHSTNNQLQYLIPFLPEDTLDKLSINISIPTLTAPLEPQSSDFIFDNVMHGKVLQLDKSNIKINEPILVKIHNNNNTPSFVQQGNHSKYIFTRIDTPTLETRNPPNKIAILWNTSFSNRLRSLEKEIQFIESYIEKVKTAEIDVFFFNQYLEKKQTLLICAENISCPDGNKSQKLIDLLKSTKYDGTNDFSSIDISKINAQEVLLFSNGIKTLFSSDLKNIDKPISVINSSINANTALLKNYAAISNGRFIDLVKYNDAEAMNQFLSTEAQVRVISSSAGINADEVFSTKIKDDIFLIIKSQHINNDESEWLTIETTTQSGKTQNTLLFDNLVVVKQSLDKLWGTKKIEKLNIDSTNNKEEIIEIAKKYKVLTDDTSLIVLDRVEDYVAYEIEPPEELKSQYDKLIKQKINVNLYENESAMIESIKALELEKLWYNKKFDSPQEKAERIAKQKALDEAKQKAERIAREKAERIAREKAAECAAKIVSDDAECAAFEAQLEADARQAALKPKVYAALKESLVLEELAAFEAQLSLELPTQASVANNSLPDLGATIELNEFVPNAAYIKDFKSVDKSKWLDEYHSKQEIYAGNVMFYVDVAHLFHKNNMKKDAIVILSNILEMEFENSELLRLFAFKAMEFNQYEMAILALKKVKDIRPFEPQSFRDLALALNANNKAEEALDNLYYILTHTWSRFPYIKSVVINEFNAILALNQNINKNKFDPRLIYLMPVDLRIVMNWSSDNSDIDLHVTDQYDEIVNYRYLQSSTGGMVSKDVTNGYGPEQFMIKAAHNGVYQIEVHYYGNTQQKLIAPVTVRVKIFSNYSSNNQKQEDIVLRLDQNKRVANIGYFEWDAIKSH